MERKRYKAKFEVNAKGGEAGPPGRWKVHMLVGKVYNFYMTSAEEAFRRLKRQTGPLNRVPAPEDDKKRERTKDRSPVVLSDAVFLES